MFTRFLVVALACVVVAVSGKASNKNHWKQIAKDVKCKEGLNNLDLVSNWFEKKNKMAGKRPKLTV